MPVLTNQSTIPPTSLYMFCQAIATLCLLSLPLIALAARPECGGLLKPYCCTKYQVTPRGYTGTGCNTLHNINDKCQNFVLCCQQDTGMKLAIPAALAALLAASATEAAPTVPPPPTSKRNAPRATPDQSNVFLGGTPTRLRMTCLGAGLAA
ncbi:hypothetical protein FPV67DRAFT_1681413 [Lyophyllum atratum]|nr:hypothetical protein FPV67DRAFT_1681413 [Lyophyllum atratum]